MDSKSCRLCLAPNNNSHLNIFSRRGIKLGIVDILSKHFKSNISESDPLPKYICAGCWTTTEAFHDLYKKSKEVQEKFLDSLMKIEHDPIDVELPSSNAECYSLAVEEFIPIKLEPNSGDNELEHAPLIDNSNWNIQDEEIGPTKMEASPDHHLPIENAENDNIEIDEKNLDGDVSESSLESESGKVIARKQNQSEKNTRAHQEIVMDEEEMFQCDICKDVFASQKKLVLHRKKHENPELEKQQYEFVAGNFDMTCDRCDRIPFSSFADARRHYRESHNFSNGYIKCCGTKLGSFTQIRDHIKHHWNPETFKCEICNKTFSTKRTLVDHKRLHLPDAKKCICDFCGKRFRDKNHIKNHIFRRHVHSEPKCECKICGKKFHLDSLLKMHYWRIHPKTQRIFTCEVCGKTYNEKVKLKNHMMSHKDKSERLEVRRQCEICGEWLMTRTSYYNHKELRHSGVQKCDQCGKELVSKTSLMAHIRKHHRTHNFKCVYCERTFSTNYLMQKHQESHTRHKLYNCQWCKATYSVHKSLHTHNRRHHPEELKLKKANKRLA